MSAAVEDMLRKNLERVWEEWIKVNRERVISAKVKDGLSEEKKRKAQELGRRWIDYIDREMKRAIEKGTHPMALALWATNVLNELGIEFSMGIEGFYLNHGSYDERSSRSLALAIWACFQYQFPSAGARV
jgi:hypothetical protein